MCSSASCGCCAEAVWPYLLGRAVDEGVSGDGARLWLWCGALLLVAAIQALTGMLRHRMAVSNWLRSSPGDRPPHRLPLGRDGHGDHRHHVVGRDRRHGSAPTPSGWARCST
ncbi:hypothetical protein ACRAWC_22745 [Leifsonia sp. L25]|uniref:hypothetical protein n=1 Tax=Leifsonia sp. L25 TaxID=3423957 RepID=UPI003D68D863